MTWALPDDVLDLLDRHLAGTRPARTVECGSGRSTEVFARHVTDHAAYEHEPRYAATTRDLLPPGTGHLVVVAPLTTRAYGRDRYRFYDVTPPSRIDFALIDGPPGERYGRQACGLELIPRMAPGGEIWLDDYGRDHERGCVERWERDWPLEVTELAGGRLARIRVY